jgi:hypothetical protein
MTKTAVSLSLVLSLGIVLGLSAHYIGNSPPSIRDDPHQTTAVEALKTMLTSVDATEPEAIAAPAIAADEVDTDAEDSPQQLETGRVEATGPQPDLADLRLRLAAETRARQSLESQLRGLEADLQQLQQQLAELTREQAPARRFGNDRQIDEAAFIAAGLPLDTAAELAQRLNQQEMDQLYLRDQAIREGWFDTPRYQEELQALRGTNTSLREELGTDAYDRYLYASGRPNRVVVDSVIGDSPGQVVGLQAGDRIVSYNGNRIFSPGDLRTATTSGEADDYVAMQVDRSGQLIEYYVPAGPIGVRINVDSVEP